MARAKKLRLSDIVLHPKAQPRVEMNAETVEDYSADMIDGRVFPPIIVFEEISEGAPAYLLADGFHRYHAAKLAGVEEISVEIHLPIEGETALRSSVLYSIGANSEHGLRRTNEDKRRGVATLLQDKVWGLFSNREFAQRANVSDWLGGDVRKVHLQEHADTSDPETVKFERGGKVHEQKRRKTSAKKKVVAENKPAAKSLVSAEKMAESISAVDIDPELCDAVAGAEPVDPAAAINDIFQNQSIGEKLELVNETMQSLPMDPKAAFVEAIDEGQWLKWKDAQHWSDWFDEYAQAAREEITR